MDLLRTRTRAKVKVGSKSFKNGPGPQETYQLEEEIKILQNLISMLSYGMVTSKRQLDKDKDKDEAEAEARKDAMSVIKEIQRIISKLQYIEKYTPKGPPPAPCAPHEDVDFNGEAVILKVESAAKDRVIESLQQELEEVKKIKCQKEEEVRNWIKRHDVLVEHSVERGFLVQESDGDGSEWYRLAEKEELEKFYSISFHQAERVDKSVGCEAIDFLQEVGSAPAVLTTDSLSTAGIGLAISTNVSQESVATEKSIPEERQLRPRVPKVIPRVPPTNFSPQKSNRRKTVVNAIAVLKSSDSNTPPKKMSAAVEPNSSLTSSSDDISFIRPNPRGLQPLPKGVKVRQYNYTRIRGSERVHCKECKRIFNEATAFRYHYRVEHLGVRYECEKCLARFTAPNGLKFHEKRCGEPGFKQPCYICKFRFVGLKALKAHMKKEHDKK